MKLSELIVVGASVTSVTSALTLRKRSDPAIVRFPIERRLVVPGESGHHRRAIPVPLFNERYYVHEVNVTLGTPAQSFRALLDTGASTVLVHTPKSDLCTANKDLCSKQGTYNANSSATYHYLSSDLSTTFWSSEATKGDYATDDLVIGGVKVKSLQFGIMHKTNVSSNILGLGYDVAKTLADPKADTPDTLATLLVKQKAIESRAFSLWLHDLNLPGGELLFGGVDTGKYDGKLITIPFAERVRDTVIDYSVILNGIQMTNSTGGIINFPSKVTPVFALLDSGAAQTILPDDIVDAIFTKLAANVTNPRTMPTVNCSLIKDTSTIDFLFENSLKIKVPLSQFIYPLAQTGQCPLWGLAKTSQVPYNSIILGTSFLGSAYVVFDMDNKEASIAQSKPVPTASNILQITSGGNAVPGVNKTWNGILNVGRTVGDWEYLGCAKETKHRMLSPTTFNNNNMTIEICQDFCTKQNHQIAALQWSRECWCGHALLNGGATGDPGCDMACKGNVNEICGGANHNSIFLNTAWIPTANPKIVNDFGYIGCFQELNNARLLSGPSLMNQPDMTAEKCTSFCRSKSPNVVFAGLQFSKECFCSLTLPTGIAIPASESSCDMECSGNDKQWCGGARRISLYKNIDSP